MSLSIRELVSGNRLVDRFYDPLRPEDGGSVRRMWEVSARWCGSAGWSLRQQYDNLQGLLGGRRDGPLHPRVSWPQSRIVPIRGRPSAAGRRRGYHRPVHSAGGLPLGLRPIF